MRSSAVDAVVQVDLTMQLTKAVALTGHLCNRPTNKVAPLLALNGHACVTRLLTEEYLKNIMQTVYSTISFADQRPLGKNTATPNTCTTHARPAHARSQARRHVVVHHVRLHLFDADLAAVEDAGGQGSGGAGLLEHLSVGGGRLVERLEGRLGERLGERLGVEMTARSSVSK